ncbi:hypothetical protein WMZ97_15365 [Lentibacillus sp. N15]|uniref:hypothetical protein n=1 Tax=Lentibacillus songyuanensis TaxID=3136161 RepID=UPI0031BA3DFB
MKQTNKFTQIIGWLLFLFAIGFFCLQMGYFFVHAKFQAEYIDNRIFYIVNMLCVISAALAILLLVHMIKKWKWIGTGVVVIFVVVNIMLLVNSNQQIRNITSISPDFKHVFSIKEDIKHGEAVYYRSYYGILALPKEKLPYEIGDETHVEWLADDVAAFTYNTADDTVHQFVGTYGDRGGDGSYYYVGPQMHGEWKGDNVRVVSNTDGITVTANGKTESFDWDHIVQFGTLAVVLTKGDKAAWTLSLNKNFEVHSDASIPASAEISLYKASLEKEEPRNLRYSGGQE